MFYVDFFSPSMTTAVTQKCNGKSVCTVDVLRPSDSSNRDLLNEGITVSDYALTYMYIHPLIHSNLQTLFNLP